MLFIKTAKYQIKIYNQPNAKAPFTDWASDLDKMTRARINARVARFEDGHFGDHKMLGDGVIEARLFFGAGYRIYFAIHAEEIILLLIGGNKATQTNDVKKAKEFLKSFLEVQNANKK